MKLGKHFTKSYNNNYMHVFVWFSCKYCRPLNLETLNTEWDLWPHPSMGLWGHAPREIFEFSKMSEMPFPVFWEVHAFKRNLKILNHTILNQHISHKKVGVLRLFHFWIFHRCDPMPNLRKFCHSLRHRGGGKKNIIIIIKKTFLTKGQCSKR